MFSDMHRTRLLPAEFPALVQIEMFEQRCHHPWRKGMSSGTRSVDDKPNSVFAMTRSDCRCGGPQGVYCVGGAEELAGSRIASVSEVHGRVSATG